MREKAGESEKEGYLRVRSEIVKDGIQISLKGKDYRIRYSPGIWKKISSHDQQVMQDNLVFMQTCHLAASHKRRGADYDTAQPFFESFAFHGTMYDIPSTAVIDYEKTSEYMKAFFNSDFKFDKKNMVVPLPASKRKLLRGKKKKAVVLFTAGKESLLTLGLCMEMGIEPILIYMDENPKGAESMHKEKIIARFEKDYGIAVHKVLNEPGKLRYCDLGEEANNWGAGTQFLTYVLLVSPFVKQYKADYVFFGNEHSCDDYTFDKEGFKSNFCFDQCSDWSRQLNAVAKAVCSPDVTVGSLVAPLYELGLTGILHARYPELGKLQMSCFSDTAQGQERVWCGNCSKCARLFVFFKGLGVDTSAIGFENNMFVKASKKHYSVFGGRGYSFDISGLGKEEQALAFYMAMKRGESGTAIDDFKRTAAYRQIKKNFGSLYEKYFSCHENPALPAELKKDVLKLFDETFRGDFVERDFRVKRG